MKNKMEEENVCIENKERKTIKNEREVKFLAKIDKK